MLALDLFCAAGGATRGLQRAGFRVIGVDIEPQPNYIGDGFLLGDATQLEPKGFDFIWASPPCQAFTAYKRRPEHVAPRPNLIPTMRAILEKAGCPWVIENVEGARAELRNPVTLCGSMFGLDVRRHRCFETSFPLAQPPCNHAAQTPRFAQATNRKNLRSTVEVGVWRIPLDVQHRAMGIDWMTREELSQAVPPAYSEWIARCSRSHRPAAEHRDWCCWYEKPSQCDCGRGPSFPPAITPRVDEEGERNR